MIVGKRIARDGPSFAGLRTDCVMDRKKVSLS